MNPMSQPVTVNLGAVPTRKPEIPEATRISPRRRGLRRFRFYRGYYRHRYHVENFFARIKRLFVLQEKTALD